MDTRMKRFVLVSGGKLSRGTSVEVRAPSPWSIPSRISGGFSGFSGVDAGVQGRPALDGEPEFRPAVGRCGGLLGVALLALVSAGCGDSSPGDGEGRESAATDDELGDQGSAEQGSSDQGSGEQGTSDQGSETSESATADNGESESETDSESETNSGSETNSESETNSGSETNSEDDTDGSDSSTDGPMSTTGGDGCDKVDFVFVIDNSVSMLPEQEALSAAFPGFIAAIEESLDTDDHILVTDTDLSGWCTAGNCANPDTLHPTCEGPDSYACTLELEACDITMGSGVVKPAGQAASNMFCDPFGGNRYMIEDEPEKVDVFNCMAHVGLAGFPSERPLDALVQTVSPNLNGEGGCNEGFLRDDAILVLTFISDDDDNNEFNSPADAFEAVLAAKGGDLDRVVVLGLTPGDDNNCSFTPGAGDHWVEFIEMFGDQGLHGGSCDDDYIPFFQGAVDTIVEACQANPQ